MASNDRFRDLIDLPLLRDLMSPGQLPAVREACVETFALRATHSLAANGHEFDGWESGYAALAEELDFPLRNVHQAGDAVQAMMVDIDAAA